MITSADTKKFLLKLCITLLIGIAVITGLHIFIHSIPNAVDNYWLIRMFDLDTEGNVPSWFASMLWFMVALAAIAAYFSERALNSLPNSPAPKRFGFFWMVIATVFVVASADEIATIHEEVGGHLQDWHSSSALGKIVAVGQNFQSAPNSPWIIYYLPLFIAFALIAIAFFVQRFRQQRMFIIMCLMCVNCYAIALAADHYEGLKWDKLSSMANQVHLSGTAAANLAVTVEETLENLGSMLLILAFAGYAHGCARLYLNKLTHAGISNEPPAVENADSSS